MNEFLLVHRSQTGGDLLAISSASFTSSGPERLMRFSSVSPATNSIAYRCAASCDVGLSVSSEILKQRLAGLDPANKTLAKHAYRTEFHRSRKLVAAARAGALGLRFHGPNRRSRASQRVKFCPLFGISSRANIAL